ncbi:hypothetical protein MPER_16266, partial [Moniliophthora perniciosa FA553]
QSFLRIFNKDDQGHLQMGFNATFDVQTTKELKVSGLIGHAISAGKKSACVGETEIGIGQTIRLEDQCHHYTNLNRSSHIINTRQANSGYV